MNSWSRPLMNVHSRYCRNLPDISLGSIIIGNHLEFFTMLSASWSTNAASSLTVILCSGGLAGAASAGFAVAAGLAGVLVVLLGAAALAGLAAVPPLLAVVLTKQLKLIKFRKKVSPFTYYERS